jgi:colicin import membrane protein
VSAHKGAIVYSVALHAAIVAVLMANVQLPSWRKPAVIPAPIQGVLIDSHEQERREEAQRQEQQRQRAERQRQERAAAERRAQERRDQEAAAKKREEERIAAEARERQRQADLRAERERQEAAKREQERQAQEKREQEARAAAERKAREEAARREQAERELQASIAREKAAAEAARVTALEQYIATITNRIERNWVAPLSAKPGLNCTVNVVQIPSGDVIDVRVANCNGDEAVVRSIEAAVKKSSPLPKPSDPSLFERNLNVHFQPNL